MNDSFGKPRKRNQTMLVVEGESERELFRLIFRCFPELSVPEDSIWVYSTNIYMLYRHILKEYGPEWEKDDIDLPFIISKAHKMKTQHKRDFTNIIIVFDYERQDPDFSEEKINKLQRYFCDETDVGKLYLNFPMSEACLDLQSLPDKGYTDRKWTVSSSGGSDYKDLVHRRSAVESLIVFPKVLDNLLKSYKILDDILRTDCCEKLLAQTEQTRLLETVRDIMSKSDLNGDNIERAIRHICAKVKEMEYVQDCKSYWDYTRGKFKEIIEHNICKAARVQNYNCNVDTENLKSRYEMIDLQKILDIQNDASRDLGNGFIWVLATCVFVVPEYNFKLMGE